MSGDADSPPDAPLSSCPRCDRPVATVTVVGPGEAVAAPCGCRVAPGTITASRLE
ncbi:hypothetical protein [Halopiger goleimassiliensis]|uniref:hypothetical protein n=1 Tax=Halopiger goleimassiliensis TaxID=1293048 RepID=UPI000A4BB91C|nr:hypothetical protein [Halopiger goleimassiliensis]